MINKLRTSDGKIIKVHYKPLYLGVQLIDKKIAKLNLFDIVDAFEKHNVRYGLFAGTLLGAIRENDFISHDEDVDLFVLDEDKQRVIDLLPELLEKGFEVVRYHRTGKMMSVIRNGQYTDFSFYSVYNKDLRITGEWLTIDEFITKTVKYTFLGKAINIPENYKGFLESTYGVDWRIPVQWNNYEMPVWKRSLLNIKERIKESIPSPLYYYLINKVFEKKKIKYIDRITKYCNNNSRPLPSFSKEVL